MSLSKFRFQGPIFSYLYSVMLSGAQEPGLNQMLKQNGQVILMQMVQPTDLHICFLVLSSLEGNILSWSCRYLKMFKVRQLACPQKLLLGPWDSESAAKTVYTTAAKGTQQPGFLHSLLTSAHSFCFGCSHAIKLWDGESLHPFESFPYCENCMRILNDTILGEGIYLGSPGSDF